MEIAWVDGDDPVGPIWFTRILDATSIRIVVGFSTDEVMVGTNRIHYDGDLGGIVAKGNRVPSPESDKIGRVFQKVCQV